MHHGRVPRIIVLMGVSGAGKSTVGRLLADRLGWSFVDADHLHPPENVERMRAGRPLRDEDRTEWLETVRNRIRTAELEGGHAVVACSALKAGYRRFLHEGSDNRAFVYLRVTESEASGRLPGRTNHFFPASLVKSQFETLETPDDSFVLDVDASLPPAAIVELICQHYSIGSDAG